MKSFGTFEKKAGGVPMNTYYFSKSKSITNPATGTGKHMFFRHTMEGKSKTWSAYSCIIAPKDGGFQNSWDQTPTLNISNSQDDSFPGVSAPAKYMMSFDAVDEIVNGELNTNRAWWPQAEAALAFEFGWRMTREPVWLERLKEQWRYILRVIADSRAGSEWLNELSEDGASIGKPLVEEWKCPYHNGRMCLRLMSADLPESL